MQNQLRAYKGKRRSAEQITRGCSLGDGSRTVVQEASRRLFSIGNRKLAQLADVEELCCLREAIFTQAIGAGA